MSLEEYRNTIEEQQRSEKNSSGMSSSEPREYIEYSTPKSKSSGRGKLLLGIVIIALLFLAALKNPSNTEAVAEIKTMMVEKVTDMKRQEMTSEDSNSLSQIGSGLAMLFAPTIIDKMVNVEVSDYVIFSTFDASVTVDEEKRTIAAGVIVFGKYITLKSDIKKDSKSEPE